MGLLQTAGFLIYSVATREIEGKSALPGVVLVWPIYTASMLIIGNLKGLLRGEWKGSDRRTFILLAAGLALLVVHEYLLPAELSASLHLDQEGRRRVLVLFSKRVQSTEALSLDEMNAEEIDGDRAPVSVLK
jgi:hypothetical protein